MINENERIDHKHFRARITNHARAEKVADFFGFLSNMVRGDSKSDKIRKKKHSRRSHICSSTACALRKNLPCITASGVMTALFRIPCVTADAILLFGRFKFFQGKKVLQVPQNILTPNKWWVVLIQRKKRVTHITTTQAKVFDDSINHIQSTTSLTFSHKRRSLRKFSCVAAAGIRY